MDAGLPWRILMIDDESKICTQVQQYFDDQPDRIVDGRNLMLETAIDFQVGLERIERERFDLVVLDVRLDNVNSGAPDYGAGTRALEDIKRRRFVPVVFYTAVHIPT